MASRQITSKGATRTATSRVTRILDERRGLVGEALAVPQVALADERVRRGQLVLIDGVGAQRLEALLDFERGRWW